MKTCSHTCHTGATFIPVQVHPGSLLLLCISLHVTKTKCHTKEFHSVVNSLPNKIAAGCHKAQCRVCTQGESFHLLHQHQVDTP